MTTQVLSNELGNLIQEGRKKYPEIKNAAEKSLQDLKAIPVTSEAQVSGDLRRRPNFVEPFLLACSTRNSKLVLPAVSCLHRLVVSSALPQDSLAGLLKAFQETSNLNQDVQIKILQILPLLLQNYGSSLEGDLIAGVLQTCGLLQQIKTPAVANIAAATFQQVVIFVFEKVETEDEKEIDAHTSIQLYAEESPVPVGVAAYDAYKLFHDLCLLTEGEIPTFIKGASLSMTFGLELLESILNNHAEVIASHAELTYLLKTQLLPLLTRFISERLDFPITVRAVRILCILLRELLGTLEADFELPLSLLVHSLEADASTPWRRALAMEVFKIIYSNTDLAIGVYTYFDLETSRRSIMQDSMSTFVRIAAERPSVIGLGKQSSTPHAFVGGHSSAQEQAGLESGSAAEIMVSSQGTKPGDTVGISTQWSMMKPSCLDSLDKADTPTVPETYIYGLVLICINNLVESLAKVILPLTVQPQNKPTSGSRDSSDRQSLEENVDNGLPDEDGLLTKSHHVSKKEYRAVPINPLELFNHRSYNTVQTTAAILDQCWPAVLATFSTFFNASLDADFYRMLIRSTQKLTQVAGILRLATARDAFLTTLAKAAVPLNVLHNDLLSPAASATESPKMGSNSGAFRSVENFFIQVSLDSSRRPSADVTALSQRNLMCLRALMNLAIALGPILDKAWTIILETLQKADLIILSSNAAPARESRSGSLVTGRTPEDSGSTQTSLQSEVAAVDAATDRLIESTVDWPDHSFLTLLDVLCKQICKDDVLNSNKASDTQRRTPRRVPSMTGFPALSVSQSQNDKFNLTKLGRLVEINIHRFTEPEFEVGWTTLTNALLNAATNPSNERPFRVMAADLLCSVAAELILLTINAETDVKVQMQTRSLELLEQETKALYGSSPSRVENGNTTDLEVHRSVLTTINTVLEKCGESLSAGWPTILAIIGSVFRTARKTELAEDQDTEGSSDEAELSMVPISTRLVQTSFASVQLICSDLFSIVPATSVLMLINHLLYNFCSQRKDLNISLTTITLFWNVSDALQGQTDQLALPSDFNAKESRSELVRVSVDAAERGSNTAMWMIAQLRLASMTNDPRDDVRNGAVYTIFRILDSCGDRMSPTMWETYIRSVILPMLEGQGRGLAHLNHEDATSVEGSLKIILQGLNGIFASSSDILVALPAFEEIWYTILGHLEAILQTGSYNINKVVFENITQTLAPFVESKKLSRDSVQAVAELWARCVPSPTDARPSTNANDSALIAYVELLRPIYRLTATNIQAQQVITIIRNLQQCVELALAAPYGSDVDTPTKLQTAVLSTLRILRTDIELVPLKLIVQLASFTALPYGYNGEQTAKRCSFVAFAKKAMEFLETVYKAHVNTVEIYQGGGYLATLKALRTSVRQKYEWEPQGQSPALWAKATSAAIAILELSDPVVQHLDFGENSLEAIWVETIGLFNSIAHANLAASPANQVLLSDETFDIASLQKLCKIITPSLCARGVSDNTRSTFLLSLFNNSLIHAPRASELPSMPRDHPLKDLYKTRFGQTFDPPFNRRIRMSYFCLDELFSLASSPEPFPGSTTSPSDSSGVSLARLALPYLILRCALPLKAYIADQPLRGRMPTPQSQRLELLHMLQKLRTLTCDAGAFPEEDDGQGMVPPAAIRIKDQSRRHLEWLMPLVNRALGEAGRDEEVMEALKGVMDVVIGTAGSGFV